MTDPRQAAYDAVYAEISRLGDYMPPDRVHRNAIIWRAVNAAIDAADVPPLADPPAHNGGPSTAECAANDRLWPLQKDGE